ncbi:hypothetical protein CUJ84_pRLN1000879 (plasmid) [Rhizobium leguminosarum]|uniref:Uncharacterized protein n=1 Tax=Rhizobium leguminosarum TaxID=384 RepID=A0A2K9ZDL8_RHILE|nr:hypothetical protein CUJ84_pRLN1000879 [Rhizobium leguminosarum]
MTTALPPFFTALAKKQGFFGSATNLVLAALPKWINENGSAANEWLGVPREDRQETAATIGGENHDAADAGASRWRTSRPDARRPCLWQGILAHRTLFDAVLCGRLSRPRQCRLRQAADVERTRPLGSRLRHRRRHFLHRLFSV